MKQQNQTISELRETEEPLEHHTDVELDFDEADLEDVEISDSSLEEDDKKMAAARKEAKKTAKKIRTPEEKKKLRIKKALIGTGLAIILIFVLLAVPLTRWPILNVIGFRGKLVVTISEDSSKKPVFGAYVRLSDGTQLTTDTYGRVAFVDAKLGKQEVVIQKTGYGEKRVTFTNGVGTTQGAALLKSIGIKIDFDIKDWLSGDAVSGATATYGKATATSDKTGRVSLVIPPTDIPKVDVELSAPGYIAKTISTETNVESREVSLVSAQKNYFISKRDGKFDIFSSNLDGTAQQKIVEATGKEEESLLQFTINKNNKQAILVSNRDGKIQGGKVVAGVYLIDLEKSAIKKIDEGSDVQLLDWSESTLAYTKTEAALNYDDPALSRIVSYNIATSKLAQIAQSNYFPLSIVAQNKLFFMPADAYRSIDNASLTSIDLGNGVKKTYLTDRQIGYGVRVSYNTIELQDSGGANFELQVGSGSTRAIDRRPGAQLSFAANPSGQNVIWSDRRDGQGALLVKNLKANDEKVVLKAGGLTAPVRYVTDTLAVVRIATSEETADYVVNTNSGKIAKIVDVSNIGILRQPGL